MQNLTVALDTFERMGYTAHDIQDECKTVQFTLKGETRVPRMLLSQVMGEQFPEHIYAFASTGNDTTVKIIK